MGRSTTQPGSRGLLVLLLGLALAGGPLLLPARPALAATITVTSTADNPDVNPNDGVCDAAAGPTTTCTLRAAIETANVETGGDTIAFNIPGGGLQTIRPVSNLPAIEAPATINGYTQPGSKPNTATTGTNAVLMIELDGTNAGPTASGITIEASNTLVRGLVVNRFDDYGIIVQEGVTPPAGVRVAGNFVGTDAGGTVARANGFDGVLVLGGVDVTIGGPSPAARNLISGNTDAGVALEDGSNIQVYGNLIGTTRRGLGDLGNGGDGICSFVDNVIVGGAAPHLPNAIAYNGGSGVRIDAIENRVLVNSIFLNDELGIDLDSDGITPNDDEDPDPGANFRQNYPVITVATSTSVQGTFNSNPNQQFNLRLFSNRGNGDEGRFFEAGPLPVTTDANGDATFTFTPTTPIPPDRSVTATATRIDGNTSEFSAAVPVTAGGS